MLCTDIPDQGRRPGGTEATEAAGRKAARGSTEPCTPSRRRPARSSTGAWCALVDAAPAGRATRRCGRPLDMARRASPPAPRCAPRSGPHMGLAYRREVSPGRPAARVSPAAGTRASSSSRSREASHQLALARFQLLEVERHTSRPSARGARPAVATSRNGNGAFPPLESSTLPAHPQPGQVFRRRTGPSTKVDATLLASVRAARVSGSAVDLLLMLSASRRRPPAASLEGRDLTACRLTRADELVPEHSFSPTFRWRNTLGLRRDGMRVRSPSAWARCSRSCTRGLRETKPHTLGGTAALALAAAWPSSRAAAVAESLGALDRKLRGKRWSRTIISDIGLPASCHPHHEEAMTLASRMAVMSAGDSQVGPPSESRAPVGPLRGDSSAT